MEPITEFANFPKVRFNVVNLLSSERENPPATEIGSQSLDQILLMTDFSPRGRVAYTHAAELAEKNGARITLTHFGQERPPDYSGISNRDHRRQQIDSLNHERRSPELANTRTSSRLVVNRNVVEAVRKFEDDLPSDLVVVYVSASTRFGRFSSIDYAGDLLIGASVPVLLVGPKVQLPNQDSTSVALVPFDLRRNAAAPFHSIDWVARHFECSFLVSQVTRSTSTENPRWFDWWARWNQATTSCREATLSQQLDEVGSSGANAIQFELQKGEPIRTFEVARRARELNASFIVVSGDRKLRNRVLNLVREAPCPVLAVPNPV